MVLDSNIIIYAVEAQNPKVLQFIANNRTFVSPISKVEVLGYHNVSPANKQNLEAFFQKMPTLKVSIKSTKNAENDHLGLVAEG